MKTNHLLAVSILTASLAATLPALAGGFMGFSSYEGRTTIVAGNGEGSRTVFSFGVGGMHADMRQRPMPGSIQVDDGRGGWMDYHRPARSDVIGSSIYRGRETVVTRNGDGSHTVNVTENGRTTSEVHREAARGTIQVDDGKGGWTDYKPLPKSDVIGSGTYGGRTTTVTKNGDGSHTVTINENGKTSSEIHREAPKGSIQVDDGKGGWKPYVPQPRSNVTGSSTYDGKTTTVTDNGNGTHTVSVTDENGKTSSEVHAAHR